MSPLITLSITVIDVDMEDTLAVMGKVTLTNVSYSQAIP
jgi:hypothetical protein